MLSKLKKLFSDGIKDREDWRAPLSGCTSVLFTSTRKKHDSGYDCIEVVCVNKQDTTRVTRSSDVLELYKGDEYLFSIDCQNQIAHIFTRLNNRTFTIGPSLSSLDIKIVEVE